MAKSTEKYQSYEEYVKALTDYNALHVKSVMALDAFLVQICTGLLVVMGTFGKDIFLVNKILGNSIGLLLTLTIVVVIIGYALSNRYLDLAKQEIQATWDESDKYTSINKKKVDTGRIVDLLNIIQVVLFVAALGLFACATLMVLNKC